MRRERGTSATIAGTALLAGLALLAGSLAGCTAEPDPPARHRDPGVPTGGFQLVAFSSCADALTGLRAAAKAYVGPYGFGHDARTFGRPEAAGAERAAGAVDSAGQAGPPAHSGTNTHEAGVDEPDLVKTDGRRIVTVSQGILRVVDPASRRLTGTLDLTRDVEGGWPEADLLLHGDRALVLVRRHGIGVAERVPLGGRPGARPAVPPADEKPVVGPRLILVDLSGAPRITGEYRIDGHLVDARQMGATVRVVVRSAPRLEFPVPKTPQDTRKATAANQKVVDEAGIEAWLPRYETTVDGRTSAGMVDCERLSRPATYSGTSLVTLLSFDLAAKSLGDGDPVTVVADADTVYSNGQRLYLASDQRWRMRPQQTVRPDDIDERTEIYQFDTSGTGRPRYVAAGSVPGWLLNQYAMSEWDGHLRVATTSGQTWGENPKSSSAVYVLRADGRTLVETGRVTGLGKGERIFSVRFVEATGYVVTFRQTDPLYTLDLRDPRAPRVTGELKITGYSGYLHPVAGGRLIGVGQEADTRGRTQGTQVSLFDVSDPAAPTRIAQHHVRYGHSEAEFDPHAFLYWPATNTLVIPLTTYGKDGSAAPRSGAMVLRLTGGGFVESGLVHHTEVAERNAPEMIRRSLVIDGVLWTVSDHALKATDLATMGTLGLLRL